MDWIWDFCTISILLLYCRCFSRSRTIASDREEEREKKEYEIRVVCFMPSEDSSLSHYAIIGYHEDTTSTRGRASGSFDIVKRYECEIWQHEKFMQQHIFHFISLPLALSLSLLRRAFWGLNFLWTQFIFP